jgi:hypothetical protein
MINRYGKGRKKTNQKKENGSNEKSSNIIQN